MPHRRLVLAAASAVIATGVVWGLQPGCYLVAEVRHSYNLDAAMGLALLCGFVFVARWLGWSGRGAASVTAAETMPA